MGLLESWEHEGHDSDEKNNVIMANEYIPVQNRNQLAEAAGVLTYKFFELYGGDTPDYFLD